jgi:hypothetical protein
MQFAFTRPRVWTSDFFVSRLPSRRWLRGKFGRDSEAQGALDEWSAEDVSGTRRLHSGFALSCHCTVIGLATRGIMMIESCRVNEPTENQIPVGWNG